MRMCSSSAVRGGKERTVELFPRFVADFYREVMARLEGLGHPVHIHGRPNEVLDAIPFREDESHTSYDREAVQRFFTALRHAEQALQEFRGRFRGKSSPVHFFWGSFDLAVTRFSGRPAPLHPGGIPNLPDRITREAYSHEVHSCGWWPGDEQFPEPAFYAYGYPAPAGLASAPIAPGERSSMRASASSCCLGMRCAPDRTPRGPCSSSPRASTRPCRDWAAGTGQCWTGRSTVARTARLELAFVLVLVALLEPAHHLRVGQSGGVPDGAALRDVLEQPAHDLARARLG